MSRGWIWYVLVLGTTLGTVVVLGLKEESGGVFDEESKSPDTIHQADDDDEVLVEDVIEPDEHASVKEKHVREESKGRANEWRSRRSPTRQRAGRSGRRPRFALPSDMLGKLEWFLIALSAGYLLSLEAGRRRNATRARSWGKEMARASARHFAQVGVAEADPDGRHEVLYQEGFATFLFYATGRHNTRGLVATAELMRRQDLFVVLMGSVIKIDPDVVTIAIPFSDPIEPIIFALMLKREVHQMLEKYPDLETYCETTEFREGSLPSNLTTVANVPEVALAILSDPVRQAIHALKNEILSIHITCRGIPTDPQHRPMKNMFELVHKIPRDSEMSDKIDLIVRLVMSLFDATARFRLSKEGKETAASAFRKVEDLEFKKKEKERQDAAQSRKLEKERKRREEVAGMSREAQQKYDEQQRKRSLRRKQSTNGGIRRVVI